jgi:excisionase family DNA binding protein
MSPREPGERRADVSCASLDAVLADRLVISVEEFASLVGLGRTAAYDAVRRGDVPSRRLGRRVVIPVPALMAWLAMSVTPPDDNDGMTGGSGIVGG